MKGIIKIINFSTNLSKIIIVLPNTSFNTNSNIIDITNVFSIKSRSSKLIVTFNKFKNNLDFISIFILLNKLIAFKR